MKTAPTFGYPVRLTTDDNGTISVTFPDFPDAHTLGQTRDEALARAVDALTTSLDSQIRRRQAIPRPSTGQLTVPLPALMATKLALYEAMRDQHVRKTELARRLDWHLPQVDRLLGLRHASRLDQLEAAFRALGQRIAVSLQPLNPQPPNTDRRTALRRRVGKRLAQRRQLLRKRRANAR